MTEHDKIIASIKASMVIEGLEPSEYTVSLIEQYANGKIIVEEYIFKIKDKYRIQK